MHITMHNHQKPNGREQRAGMSRVWSNWLSQVNATAKFIVTYYQWGHRER